MHAVNAEAAMAPLDYPIVHGLISMSYLFVFLATIIGNIVILGVFISQRRLRSLPKFFLVNLTVADFFVGCFCVLQNAAHFVMFKHRWPFGEMMCHMYVYLLHLLPNISAGILVLVSVERFVAVLRPLRVRRAFSRRVLVASSAAVWVSAAVMNLPYFFAVTYLEFRGDNMDTLSVCTRNLQIEFNGISVVRLIGTINFFIWYALPLTILLCIYATIFLVVRKADSSRQHTLLPEEKKASERRSGSTVTVEKRKKVGRLAFGIVVSFAVLSLPRYAYLMWFTWQDNTTPRCIECWETLLQPITFLLLFLNSAINPFLYGFLSARFRESIRDTFFCRKDVDKRRELAIEVSCRLNRQRRLNSEYDTLNDSSHVKLSFDCRSKSFDKVSPDTSE